jgi:CRISPR/Cas system-associated protein Cas10 (large subunit of type III CRISPR-Cas system)
MHSAAISAEESARIAAITAGVPEDDLRDKIRLSLTKAAQATQWKRDHDWRPCAVCGTLTPPLPSDAILCDFCRLETKLRR